MRAAEVPEDSKFINSRFGDSGFRDSRFAMRWEATRCAALRCVRCDVMQLPKVRRVASRRAASHAMRCDAEQRGAMPACRPSTLAGQAGGRGPEGDHVQNGTTSPRRCGSGSQCDGRLDLGGWGKLGGGAQCNTRSQGSYTTS